MSRDERGMVTAELAVVAPLGVAFCLLLVWVVGVAVLQVRLVDGSREAARVAARGESAAAATSAAERVLPDGARVTVDKGSGSVVVTVTARSRPVLPFFHGIGSRTMTARTTAAAEDP